MFNEANSEDSLNFDDSDHSLGSCSAEVAAINASDCNKNTKPQLDIIKKKNLVDKKNITKQNKNNILNGNTNNTKNQNIINDLPAPIRPQPFRPQPLQQHSSLG